jgi:hypothetical protein
MPPAMVKASYDRISAASGRKVDVVMINVAIIA